MAQTLGIIDISWRGKTLPIEKDSAKLTIGGLMNQQVILNRRVDRAQTFMPSEIECTLVLERGVSLIDLFDPAPGELQARCDTGQTYVFPDAALASRPAATAGAGGKISMKWFADEGEELLA